MKNTAGSRVLDMTKGKPFKLLLQFALPLFLGNLLQQFYNLADTSIAGHVLGDNALAQIGATSALYGLIINFAFGLNNGFALAVSRYFGADDKKKLLSSVGWMTILCAAFAVVLTVGFLAFRNPLMTLLQVPEETVQGAMAYLEVILIGIPLTMAYNAESALLRAVGNSTTPLILLLFSCILNVALDFWFMGPLGWGVRGAAIATILSQGISAVVSFVYIIKCYSWLCFGKEDCKTEPQFVRGILTSGLSMGLMSAIFNIGSVVLQSSINALGEIYIAAQVGARRLAEFFYMPGSSIGTAAATFAGQNYGAGQRRRIAKGALTAIVMYVIWWSLAMLLTFTVGGAAVRLITGSDSAEVLENALMYLKISVPIMPPMGVLVILRNVMQGMDRPFVPLFCSVLELIGKLIFALFIVPAYGYIAVCICEPTTWVVCFAVIAAAALHNRSAFSDDIANNGQAA